MTATTSTSSPALAIRRWHVACLAIIVMLAGVLRAYRIDATSLWCDEFLSIHFSNGNGLAADHLPRDVLIEPVPDMVSLAAARPAWRIWTSMQDDVHPPLYYVALRLWRDVFGDTPAGLRSLSATLGVLAVVAMFFAGRELAGTAAGLCVAALNALAANHVYYGHEARMYTLVLLWISAAMAIVLRIDRRGFTVPLGIGLATCALGTMLTLYLSAPVLLAAALYALFRMRRRERVGVILSLAAAGVAFAIVWGPFLLRQSFHGPKVDWQIVSRQGHAAIMADLIATLPIYQFGVPLTHDDRYAYTFAIMYVLPALFVRRCPAILFPWIGMLLVVGVPAGIDWYRSTNTLMWHRYTILLIPTLSLTIVAMAFQMRAWARWTVPGALLAFCALSLVPVYQKERYDFRNNARVAEAMSLAGGGRLVVMSTWMGKFNSVLLLACQYYWHRPPQGVVFVESVEALARLPRSATGDRIVLMAGDRDADDLRTASQYEYAGRATRAVGVGTVMTFRRNDAPATRPAAAAAGEGAR